MPTTIAILNQKGGVGKTTTAVTLVSGFARKGYQVLLVDLDTQGNAADSLGIPQSDDLRRLFSPYLRQPLEQVITPFRLEKLAVNGVRDALQSLVSLKRFTRCQLAGILPTFYQRVTIESHVQLTHLAQTFGRLVLPPIPQDTHCRVASRFGKTLWEYELDTRALVGYEAIGDKKVGGYVQVMERVEGLL
jgi:cellulose biosynthesis protein BcsQ